MTKIPMFAIFGLMIIFAVPAASAQSIPEWIKTNAGWWSEGLISDDDFISGIQFLIKQEILIVPPTSVSKEESEEIPDWVKNNAGWWSEGLISDDDFINGVQFLIKISLISIQEEVKESAHVQTLVGKFVDADFIHRTSGTATVTISENDQRILQFDNFETLNGPDLFVYLSTDNSASDFVNLGMLERFKGEQSYEISNEVDIAKYNKVLVWCKAFGVLFGSADLS